MLDLVSTPTEEMPELLLALSKESGSRRQYPDTKNGPCVVCGIDDVIRLAGTLVWTDEEECGDVCFECQNDHGVIYRLVRITQASCKISLEGYVDEESEQEQINQESEPANA